MVVSAITKGKFLKGMRKLIKKKKSVVNVTSANLKQQVLKQGTGKIAYFDYSTAQVFDSIPSGAVPTWIVRCISAPQLWTQCFDLTLDTNDRQIPRVSLKTMNFGLTINLERPGCVRTVYCWIASMKKDLLAYINGTDLTAANMVADQAYVSGGESIHLNPEFFDIKKSWVTQLGSNTAGAGSPVLGTNATDLRSRKFQVRHNFKPDWVFSDTTGGWKLLTEQDLNPSRRWYLICAAVSLYGTDDAVMSLYQSTLCKIVY